MVSAATIDARRPTLVGRFKAGSLEWHRARENALGGSEVAAALGLSTFESPFSLWHRKAGMIGPTEDNGEMYWGRVHEPALRREFAKRHPEFVVKGDLGMWRHDEYPFVLSSPDGLLYEKHGLSTFSVPEVWEGKTARIRDQWGDEGTDDVPVGYRAQGLWNCMVFGAPRVHFSVLFSGCDYAEFVVEYDEMEAGILLERGRMFIQSLADGIRPDIDSHSKTYETIRKLTPGIEDFDVELDADIAIPYLKAVSAYAVAEDAKREATSRVLDAIGAGRRALWLDEPIARRQRKGDADPFLVHIPAKSEKKVIA
jgi:putative phage-type endonuclease